MSGRFIFFKKLHIGRQEELFTPVLLVEVVNQMLLTVITVSQLAAVCSIFANVISKLRDNNRICL